MKDRSDLPEIRLTTRDSLERHDSASVDDDRLPTLSGTVPESTRTEVSIQRNDSESDLEEPDHVIIEYCKRLKSDPDNEKLYEALFLYVRSNSPIGNLDLQLKELMANDYGCGVFSIVSLIGQEYLSLGYTTNAIKLLELAMVVCDDDSRMRQSVVGALSQAYFKHRDFRKAIEYLELQLEYANKLGDIDLQENTHETISKLAFLEGRIMVSIKHLKEVVELKTRTGKCVEKSVTLLSDLLLQAGDYDSACEILKRGNLIPSNADRLIRLVKVLITKRKLNEAIKICEEIQNTSTDSMMTALAICFKCKCLIARRETSKAINMLKSSIIRLKAGQTSSKIVALFFGILNECHLAIGKFTYAYKWTKKQLRIAIEYGFKDVEIDAIRNLANIFIEIADYANSLILSRKYYQLCEHSTIGIDLRLSSLSYLAKSLRKCDHQQEEEHVLLQRLKLAQATEAPTLIITAHSDLTKFYRRITKKDEREYHYNSAKALLMENWSPVNASLVLHNEADILFDDGKYCEATKLYAECLMLIQEEGDLLHEAEICCKLADAYSLLNSVDEALSYYQHSIAVYQQVPDIQRIAQIYLACSQLHRNRGSLTDSLTCLKYYHTLCDCIGNESGKLDALIKIGRLLLIHHDYRKAKAVITSALSVATTRNARREIGLIYGYLAECHIGLKKKRKALSAFCKQLEYFDDIDDIEGKCETLRHLIEEKLLNNDSVWALQLCHKRFEISKHGSFDYQVLVLRQCSKIAKKVGNEVESCKFLEKAAVLMNQIDGYNCFEVLIDLADQYKRYSMAQNAIWILMKCLEMTTDDLRHDQIYFEIGRCYMLINNFQSAIQFFEKGLTISTHQGLKFDLNYGIACCHFAIADHEQTLSALLRCKSMKEFIEDLNDKLELDIAVTQWHCGRMEQALEIVRSVDKRGTSVSTVLDECFMYDLLEPKNFSGTDLLHWMMAQNDFDEALKHIDHIYSVNEAKLKVVADRAIILFKNSKYRECIEFSLEFLDDFVLESPPLYSDELLLRQDMNHSKNMVDLIRFIVIVCMIEESFDEFDSIAFAEYWSLQNFCQNSLQTVSMMHLNDIKERIVALHGSILYRWSFKRYSLFWSIDKGKNCSLFYSERNVKNENLSTFYAHMASNILHRSRISQIANDTQLEKLIHDSNILINIEHYEYEREHRLFISNFPELSTTVNDACVHICVLAIGVNDEEILKLVDVQAIDSFDMFFRIQAASVLLIDFDNVNFDSSMLLKGHNRCVQDIVIISNLGSSANADIYHFTGAKCIIDIGDNSAEKSKELLIELMNGTNVNDAVRKCRIDKVRIFGDRGTKMQFSRSTILRKSVGDETAHTVQNPLALCSETATKFHSLPESLQTYVRHLLREGCPTEVAAFVEALENAENKVDIEDDDSNPYIDAKLGETIQELKLEQIAYSKSLFEDYTPIPNETTDKISENHYKELINSFAMKEYRNRKRWRQRGTHSRTFQSESEGSCRSSMSEGNTDSEAFIVDVEYYSY